MKKRSEKQNEIIANVQREYVERMEDMLEIISKSSDREDKSRRLNNLCEEINSFLLRNNSGEDDGIRLISNYKSGNSAGIWDEVWKCQFKHPETGKWVKIPSRWDRWDETRFIKTDYKLEFLKNGKISILGKIEIPDKKNPWKGFYKEGKIY